MTLGFTMDSDPLHVCPWGIFMMHLFRFIRGFAFMTFGSRSAAVMGRSLRVLLLMRSCGRLALICCGDREMQVMHHHHSPQSFEKRFDSLHCRFSHTIRSGVTSTRGSKYHFVAKLLQASEKN